MPEQLQVCCKSDLRMTGAKTRQRPGQEVQDNMNKIMNIGRNWTHIGFYGLRIKHFESPGCYEANWTAPGPQSSHMKFKIELKSMGSTAHGDFSGHSLIAAPTTHISFHA